jgi:superfamily II DNA/RNA helicase
LEERDKAANMDSEQGEEAEKNAPTGLLRSLIIAPTRELALQVIFKSFCSFALLPVAFLLVSS